MAALYANENFPFQAVLRLRELGHDVLTSSDAGRANQGIPDDEVLRFARHSLRVVVTVNRKDFVRLHRSGCVHAGIVACSQHDNPVDLAQRVHAALESAGSLGGALIRVYRPAARRP